MNDILSLRFFMPLSFGCFNQSFSIHLSLHWSTGVSNELNKISACLKNIHRVLLLRSAWTEEKFESDSSFWAFYEYINYLLSSSSYLTQIPQLTEARNSITDSYPSSYEVILEDIAANNAHPSKLSEEMKMKWAVCFKQCHILNKSTNKITIDSIEQAVHFKKIFF